MNGPGLWLAFGTGFLGGFGHCIGMCGPLVGALGLSAAGTTALAVLRPQLAYHAGRVTTYALIGGAMGLTGSFVNVAGRLAGVQDVAAVIAGGLMVAMGIGAAGASSLARAVEGRVAARVLGAVRGLSDGGGRSYPLGLVLGFLPCGLSYSAFAGAAATGGPVSGLLFALAFGVGTLPALLLAGLAASLLSTRARGILYRLGGVLVALLGVLFVLRGLHVHAPL